MKEKWLNKKYLRPQTFWDVDFEELDVLEDQNFIIKRVVERGSDIEAMYLRLIFTCKEIYDVLSRYKGVNKKALNYYKVLSQVSEG